MFEYTKPEVEVITFMALERLANMEDIDTDLPLTDTDEDLSFGETIGPWD